MVLLAWWYVVRANFVFFSGHHLAQGPRFGLDKKVKFYMQKEFYL
jgi:hypothetical protein